MANFLGRETREICMSESIDELLTESGSVPEKEQENIDTLKAILATHTGYEELISHFTIADASEVTQEDLRDYIIKTPAPVSTHLSTLFTNLNHPTDGSIRASSEVKIMTLISYLNRRRQVLVEAHSQLLEVSEKQELPSPVHETWEKTKDIAGGFLDGFNESSGKEKLVMVAGAVTAYMLLAKMLGNKKMKWAAGTVIGGGVLVAGASAMNRMVEKSTGRPVFSMTTDSYPILGFNVPRPIGADLPYFTNNQEEWEAKKHETALEQEWERLRTNKIPVDAITGLHSGDTEKRKHAFAIANICALSMVELEELYTSSKDNKKIEDGAAPSHVFSDDHLTPIERFNLVEEIVGDMGLFDNPNDKNWNWGTLKHLKDKGVLTAIYETVS